MKRALMILVVLALAAPLYAGSIIFGPAVDEGDGTCTIDWSSDVAIVAMGLDVDVTAGDPIAAVGIDSFFDIYMDAAYDEEAGDGYSYGEGTPIADQDAAGEIGLPSASFAISMGGLGGESEPLNDPCMAGTIVLDNGSGGSSATAGTLDENALRGGVIDENGAQVGSNLPIPFEMTVIGPPPDCFQEAGIDVSDPPYYAQFLAVGSPECWCYPTQCEGDADGKTQGTARGGGIYYVGSVDIGVLAGAWKVYEPGDGPGITSVVVGTVKGACADHDHASQGTARGGGIYRVGSVDIGILAGNWKVYEPGDGPGIPKACLPGNRTAP